MTTATYLVVGAVLVLLVLLVAAPSVSTVLPTVPTSSIPAMGDYDTTGGLVWTLYRDAGGPVAP
ncbi:hypothetical protein [Actinomycetospora chibensis]|uniref:Uncharacterized protein n=1 Tax=Actinomycetospora chibensis TaxID=663606 RepID=A0ABV9RTT2_9PSEU|nr:hypothetical protein [Actinomycetospora chibensis]MDD7926419.1 hypothetical protein [Actinomycetospora chibensis]